MADVSMLAAKFSDYFSKWQLIPLVLLIALIIFFIWYRRRQL